MTRAGITTYILVTSLTGQALAADILYLKNGDILSGDITAYETGIVKITTKYGQFDVPTGDLDAIQSGNARKNVALNNAINNPKNNQKNMQTNTSTVKAETTTTKVEADEKLGLWGAKWSGNANLGATARTGNTESNGINADATVKARWDKHRGELKADYNYEEDDSDVTVDNRSLAMIHDYFFQEQWFWENSGKVEQDDIDLLDYRVTLASGLGYQPYEQDYLNLKFVLGPGYQYEEFEDGTDDSSAILKWSMDYDQKFYDDLFRLFHEHDVSAPFDDFDAYLFQSESGIRMPLKKGVIASGQIDFDWDNAPAAGIKEDDTTYSLKLGYEW